MENQISYLAALRTKLLVVPGLLVSTMTTCLLLYTVLTGWTASSTVYEMVSRNRASVQIVVQVISYLLGTTQVYTTCTLLKFFLNIRVGTRAITLEKFKFWIALSGQSLDTDLPLFWTFSVVVFLVVLQGPSALWAGAITPVLTTALVTSHGLPVAQYSASTMYLWGYTATQNDPFAIEGPASIIHTSQGTFSYTPVYATQGIIINAASSASSRNGTIPRHAKIDNTGYYYIGRSYGIGAPVGLVDTPQAESYEYREEGYIPRVTCIVNASAALGLELIYQSFDDDTIPNIWQPVGTLPNGGLKWPLGTPSLNGNLTVCSLVGSAAGGRYMYGFVTGTGHRMFHNIQCEATFNLARFNVLVDARQKLITVTPETSSTEFDIDRSGSIRLMASLQPWAFSAVDTTIITNYYANAFIWNVQNIAAQEGLPSGTVVQQQENGNVTDEIRLRGVSEALESILDNSLLAFASAQIMIAHDTKFVDVAMQVNAVRIGEKTYIYLAFAMNLAVIGLYLMDLWRTHLWEDLPKFDITSINNVIIGASAGGSGVADAAKGWDGDASHHGIRNITIIRKGTALSCASVGVFRNKDNYELIGHEGAELITIDKTRDQK